MHSRSPMTCRRGSVLIVVLWASVALVSIALLFGHSMLMAYRGTDNDLAGRQADAAIEGGIRYVETLLMNTETPGMLPDITTYAAEAMPVGEATFWILGRPEGTGNGTTREFALIDEASKLNLNTVPREVLLGLDLEGMTDDFADLIVQWRDPNSSGSGSGGITATNVKGARFESPEELAMLGVATRAMLYGEDANLNGVLDSNEDDGDHSPPPDNSDGKLDPGILEYVTTFTTEPKTNASGEARVDVTRDSNGLAKVLRDRLPSRADEVLQRLGATPSTSVMQLFRRGGFSADEAEKIVDDVRGPQIEGLVNVNTASETVLACIVGVDKAEELVSARLNRAEQTRDMTWAIEILGDLVDKVGQMFTGSTWQVCADIAAVGRHGRGYRRTRVVIDTSLGTPRVIHRQNLAPRGWALGREIRDSLVMKREVR